jgi:beta-glucosidase
MLLGPAVNIHRSPLGGRNGEYMSEDPYLASRLAVGYIQGMQGAGVAACIKHFACNNQESDRFEINVHVGERALREIYLPAFEAGVKEGKVWTVMGSYNLLNGTHATANAYLLTDVLKKGWGFDGMVVSDWGIHGNHAVNVQAGNDVEMPNANRMATNKVNAALADGSITQAAIDDSVHRILRTVIRAGLLDEPIAQPDHSKVNSLEHRQLAYEVATKGIVLLKNQGDLLPLDRKQVHNIAVIGEPAKRLQIGALGSPEVKPIHSASLLDGLLATAGAGVNIRYATNGAAIDEAKAADVAIVCVSTMRKESEGRDRPSMDLPNEQSELIRAVAAVNPKTIVIVNNGTPFTMADWIENTPALIEAYLPGQEGGAALAAILFGDVNPSGKLPDTLAAKRSDYPDDGFPGANHQVDYKEGIYVGYRHFDKKDIAPLFPFGYGLSYTTFGYSNLKLSQPVLQPDGTVTVTVDVTNTGKRAGEEVVQLYMHDPQPKIDRPVRELKGFAKIALKPGETKSVSLKLTPRDLSYFDVLGKQWKANAGNYEIEVGSSSRVIRVKAPLTLEKDFTESVPLSQDHYKG